MSDEQNTEATEAEVETTEAQGVDVEKLKAEIDKWKSLSRKNEGKAKENAEAAKAWAEYQESQKTEDEKRATELEQLRARLEQAEAAVKAKDREVLASRVASAKGVPAKYLTGDTEEELVASADAFLEDIKGIAPERPAGVVPSAGTGSPKPQAASLDTGRERALNLLNAQSK